MHDERACMVRDCGLVIAENGSLILGAFTFTKESHGSSQRPLPSKGQHGMVRYKFRHHGIHGLLHLTSCYSFLSVMQNAMYLVTQPAGLTMPSCITARFLILKCAPQHTRSTFLHDNLLDIFRVSLMFAT